MIIFTKFNDFSIKRFSRICKLFPKTLFETWQKLFDLGIEEIYPGHGKPFKVEKAVGEFERWRKRIK